MINKEVDVTYIQTVSGTIMKTQQKHIEVNQF